MQLGCPACGAHNSIEAFLNDDHARRAARAAAKLPAPLGEMALLYVGMFRPRGRRLAWRRASRLLEEIGADIARSAITWKGRQWPAPVDTWRLALEEILNVNAAGKLQLPLESHGYLYAIISGLADKAEAAGERAVEANRRAGRNDDGSAKQEARSTRHIKADLLHFQSLLDSHPDHDGLKEQVLQLEQELQAVAGGA